MLDWICVDVEGLWSTLEVLLLVEGPEEPTQFATSTEETTS